jgi:hypothetical protein
MVLPPIPELGQVLAHASQHHNIHNAPKIKLNFHDKNNCFQKINKFYDYLVSSLVFLLL